MPTYSKPRFPTRSEADATRGCQVSSTDWPALSAGAKASTTRSGGGGQAWQGKNSPVNNNPRPPRTEWPPMIPTSYKPLGYEWPGREILDQIAKAVGIPNMYEMRKLTKRIYNPEDWWLVTACTDDGYATVIHNGANPHLETNKGRDGKELFPTDIHKTLVGMTGIVVHLATATVVRHSLPRALTIGIECSDDAEFRKPTMLSSFGSEVPSLATVDPDEDRVTFHPHIEGTVVYIWKHNNIPRFSTRRKLDAGASKWGSSRQFAEIWAALGGPAIASFFPKDDEPDGEGVAYAFTLAHPSLINLSRINVGTGYLVYRGAVCAKTGKMLQDGDARLKWEGLKDIVDPTYLPPLEDMTASIKAFMSDQVIVAVDKEDKENEKEVFMSDRDDQDEEDEKEEDEAFDRAMDGFLEQAVDVPVKLPAGEYNVLAHDIEVEVAAQSAAWYYPFPPPSENINLSTRRENAVESVKTALSVGWKCWDGETGERPLIYHIPHLTKEQMSIHLTHGFKPLAQLGYYFMEEPTYDPHCESPWMRAGEPVMVRIERRFRFEDQSVENYVYQPTCFALRSAIVGGADSLTQRVSAIEHLAYKHRYELNPQSATLGGEFNWRLFQTGESTNIQLEESILKTPVSRLRYEHLFGYPTAECGEMHNESVVAKIEDMLRSICEHHEYFSRVPDEVIASLQTAYENIQAEGAWHSLCLTPKFSQQDPYFLWALLVFSVCLAPHRQQEALETLYSHLCGDCGDYAMAVSRLRDIRNHTGESANKMADRITRYLTCTAASKTQTALQARKTDTTTNSAIDAVLCAVLSPKDPVDAGFFQAPQPFQIMKAGGQILKKIFLEDSA